MKNKLTQFFYSGSNNCYRIHYYYNLVEYSEKRIEISTNVGYNPCIHDCNFGFEFFMVIIGLSLYDRYNIKKWIIVLGTINSIIVFVSTIIVIWWLNERKSPGLAEKLNIAPVCIILGISIISLVIIVVIAIHKHRRK